MKAKELVLDMNDKELIEWEQMLADKNPDDEAVLYHNDRTGKVDWMLAAYWTGRYMANKTKIKVTTVREAVALKRIAN